MRGELWYGFNYEDNCGMYSIHERFRVCWRVRMRCAVKASFWPVSKQIVRELQNTEEYAKKQLKNT